MHPLIIPRELVAEKLSITPRILLRYEERGLVRPVRQGAEEGYGPDEIRRVWTIVTYQRDLGVNLAGVETILKLRDHIAEVHRQLDSLARQLHQTLEAESDPESDA